MNPSGLSLILPQSEVVEGESPTPPILSAGGPEPDAPRHSIAAEIADFLDGLTHGETLLHALYDHILDEPIPERLRELLKKVVPVSAR
jgi:Anti-sigma factor NepR